MLWVMITIEGTHPQSAYNPNIQVLFHQEKNSSQANTLLSIWDCISSCFSNSSSKAESCLGKSTGVIRRNGPLEPRKQTLPDTFHEMMVVSLIC